MGVSVFQHHSAQGQRKVLLRGSTGDQWLLLAWENGNRKWEETDTK